MSRTALLSAGGTGGHLFPAQSLAGELISRGWRVHLATDERADRFAGDFPGQVHIVPSATIASKNPIALLRTATKLLKGYASARSTLKSVAPDVVVGFGGYPTLPPILAASAARIPTVLHEQNAKMGRANRLLAARVSAVAVGFQQVGDVPSEVVVTGNPLRALAHAAADGAFAAPEDDGAIRLTVFGGSQGARYFADTVPDALRSVAETLRARIELTLQARPEDIARTTAVLNGLVAKADVSDFFIDMPARIAASHLVVCRSGASSVSELALIGRPSVLVPLPGALDDDQGHNAAVLEAMGGAVMHRQAQLDASALGAQLSELLGDPARLAVMAAAARRAAVPDASARLADLVERVASEA